jgi:hypothetical protein
VKTFRHVLAVAIIGTFTLALVGIVVFGIVVRPLALVLIAGGVAGAGAVIWAFEELAR